MVLLLCYPCIVWEQLRRQRRWKRNTDDSRKAPGWGLLSLGLKICYENRLLCQRRMVLNAVFILRQIPDTLGWKKNSWTSGVANKVVKGRGKVSAWWVMEKKQQSCWRRGNKRKSMPIDTYHGIKLSFKHTSLFLTVMKTGQKASDEPGLLHNTIISHYHEW